MIDQLHSLDIQEDQMEEKSGVTRSLIDGLFSADMIKLERESYVTRNIMDDLHSSDIQVDQMEG